MTTFRRTAARAAAVTALLGSVLALPAAVALAGPADAAPARTPGAAQAPVPPALSPVKSVSLADGVSTANVYRTGPTGGFRADVQAGGTVRTVLRTADGSPAYAERAGLHIALQPDGRVSSWVDGTRRSAAGHGTPLGNGDGHKTAHRTGYALSAKPLGAVNAGVQALRPADGGGPGDGVLLVGAGAGMAAVGAAGLGFAMLRRGRASS
ncbi:hypothetical protein [Streptomyces sp. NPDC089919]|uniref:hypothetical protein n=1 Tax=Streptomyces sp. NPDC089919 TaxID=3155188 RepID=UPI00341F0FE2